MEDKIFKKYETNHRMKQLIHKIWLSLSQSLESQSLDSKSKVMSVWITFQTHWSMHVILDTWQAQDGIWKHLKISIKIILIHTSFKMIFKILLLQDASLTVLAGRIIFLSSKFAVKKCISFSNVYKIFIKNKSSEWINIKENNNNKRTTTKKLFLI